MTATAETPSEHKASKICVIDDSASVCFAIERMLGERGLDVTSERSGTAAMEYLRGDVPDLVLLDLVLPDIEGFDVCAFIQGDPRLNQVPVVVISGIVDDEIRTKALRLGAVGVLKKPFATQDLVDLVERVLTAKDQLASHSPASGPNTSAPGAPAPKTSALGAATPSVEATADPTQTAPFQGTRSSPVRDSYVSSGSSADDLDLPVPSSDFDLLSMAVSAPDPTLAESMEVELERFNAIDNLRFAVMVHANGELRGYGDRKPKLDSTLELAALLRRGNGMSARLGNGDMTIMTLESEEGIVVLQPRDDGWLWAVGVGGRAALGKVRFLMR